MHPWCNYLIKFIHHAALRGAHAKQPLCRDNYNPSGGRILSKSYLHIALLVCEEGSILGIVSRRARHEHTDIILKCHLSGISTYPGLLPVRHSTTLG